MHLKVFVEIRCIWGRECWPSLDVGYCKHERFFDWVVLQALYSCTFSVSTGGTNPREGGWVLGKRPLFSRSTFQRQALVLYQRLIHSSLSRFILGILVIPSLVTRDTWANAEWMCNYLIQVFRGSWKCDLSLSHRLNIVFPTFMFIHNHRIYPHLEIRALYRSLVKRWGQGLAWFLNLLILHL